MADPLAMFKHTLGLALGMPVSQVDAMPYSEWIGWLAYNQIRPIPDPNFLFARLYMVIANMHGNKTKLDDWLPYADLAKPERLSADDSVKAMQSALKAASMLGN